MTPTQSTSADAATTFVTRRTSCRGSSSSLRRRRSRACSRSPAGRRATSSRTRDSRCRSRVWPRRTACPVTMFTAKPSTAHGSSRSRPQGNGSQHTKRPKIDQEHDANEERKTDEMERLAGDPNPWLVVDVAGDAAGQCRLRRERHLAGANLRMPNLTPDVGRACREPQRQDREDCDDREVPRGKAFQPPVLPQAEPGEAGRHQHHGQEEHRGSFMALDQGSRDRHVGTRRVPLGHAQLLSGRIAGNIRGNRDERDADERHEAHLLQQVAARDDRDDEETDRHHESDRRHVIEQQVHVRC